MCEKSWNFYEECQQCGLCDDVTHQLQIVSGITTETVFLSYHKAFVLYCLKVAPLSHQLTVDSICYFLQLTGILGEGWYHPPKISETTGPMTMKFLPHVKLSEEAQNQKKN